MKSLLFIIALNLTAFYCTGQILTRNKSTMKHIDLNELSLIIKEIKSEKSPSETLQVKKSGKEITAYIDPSSQMLHYSEKTDKNFIAITGSENSGYITVEREINSPIEEKADFYSDGTLKLLGKVEYTTLTKKRPIGTWYSYDEKGVLIEQKDYSYDESLYKFNIEDVIKYLQQFYFKMSSEQNINLTNSIMQLPQISINDEVVEKAQWVVSIKESTFIIRRIFFDANTGEILQERVDEIHK